MTGTVRWAELKLEEFEERLAAKPVAYLPMGLCEPHGHAAAIGLDLLKADYICDQAAARFGGIVAPSQGYHIHETGYHAPFLRETVGAANPRLAALPPDIILRTLLFQLRAFVNARPGPGDRAQRSRAGRRPLPGRPRREVRSQPAHVLPAGAG